ncbi:hypothetical protein ACF3DV_21775 [Chlorogloeopsis fritschii PCC 9212]|jgi:hypothetical protein|uniref:Uncharacterized protein n=1 Tax=Chlorogloeopsis fritschii PCC 6912 TaxID=211165 RepID=A0A433N0Z2_CHLFR|nr:hypothetical protein [Chlorogloeopsis fritschii]MBF2008881.1 hypothetical protein [Chlorogloeopsis fritschii C42_A2020_084]RUR74654.1 hypothetical protein PCC6912_51710 [Chlorogloeopsis fritschii PCC 6912]
MDALVEKLETKLHQWQPDVAEQVRQYVAEIIDLADQDALDILRSRIVEQEVLDLLDEPETR